MHPIASLLLAVAIAAVPVAAGAAGLPPITPERNSAAAQAIAKTMFLDQALVTCSQQPPPLSVRASGVAERWPARNMEIAVAANAWLEHAVATSAGDDAEVQANLRNGLMTKLADGAQQWLQQSFPEGSPEVVSCAQLLDRIDAGEFELLADPATAPILRELMAIDWPATN